MKLGLAYGMQRPDVDDHAVIEETIEQGVLADEMGFDDVWFVEHPFLTGFSMSPCPEVIYGALSQRTAQAVWNQFDAETLADRGVIVAGDPENFLKAARVHESHGWISCNSSWRQKPFRMKR